MRVRERYEFGIAERRGDVLVALGDGESGGVFAAASPNRPNSPERLQLRRPVADLLGYFKSSREGFLHAIGVVGRIPDGVPQGDPKPYFPGEVGAGTLTQAFNGALQALAIFIH